MAIFRNFRVLFDFIVDVPLCQRHWFSYLIRSSSRGMHIFLCRKDRPRNCRQKISPDERDIRYEKGMVVVSVSYVSVTEDALVHFAFNRYHTNQTCELEWSLVFCLFDWLGWRELHMMFKKKKIHHCPCRKLHVVSGCLIHNWCNM